MNQKLELIYSFASLHIYDLLSLLLEYIIFNTPQQLFLLLAISLELSTISEDFEHEMLAVITYFSECNNRPPHISSDVSIQYILTSKWSVNRDSVTCFLLSHRFSSRAIISILCTSFLCRDNRYDDNKGGNNEKGMLCCVLQTRKYNLCRQGETNYREYNRLSNWLNGN